MSEEMDQSQDLLLDLIDKPPEEWQDALIEDLKARIRISKDPNFRAVTTATAIPK